MEHNELNKFKLNTELDFGSLILDLNGLLLLICVLGLRCLKDITNMLRKSGAKRPWVMLTTTKNILFKLVINYLPTVKLQTHTIVGSNTEEGNTKVSTAKTKSKNVV